MGINIILSSGNELPAGLRDLLHLDVIRNVSGAINKNISSGSPDWTNYANPRPDLADVETDGKTFAKAESRLFRNLEIVPFAHGSDLIYPVMGVISKLLKRGEHIDNVNEIRLLKPITNAVDIYAQDSSIPSMNTPDKPCSAKGFITTSNGRRIDFHVIERISDPIQELRGHNMYTSLLLGKECSIKRMSESRYEMSLNPISDERFFSGFWNSESAQISTIMDMMTKICGNLLRGSEMGFRGFVQRVKNLPAGVDIRSITQNGAPLEMNVISAKQRRLPSGMFIIPVELSFPGQSEPTIFHIAHTTDIKVFHNAVYKRKD